MEEVAFTFQEIDETVRKKKEDTDKQKAESMRKMAMEMLGETQKRAVEEGQQENHKKKRRYGNETISFLREKAESEKESVEGRRVSDTTKVARIGGENAGFLSRSTEIYDGANAPAVAAATAATVLDPLGCC